MSREAPDGRLVRKIETLQQRVENLERSLASVNHHLAELKAPMPDRQTYLNHRRQR